MKKIKFITGLFGLSGIIPVAPAIVTSCSSTKKVLTFKVKEETNFHQILILGKTSDFFAKGFKLGDSVTITASNGWKLDDVPFYSGYFVKRHAWVLCAYAKGEQIVIARKCMDSPPSLFGLDDKATVTIALKEEGKYANIQKQLDLTPIDQEKTSTDEQFANFRDGASFCTNKMKQNLIYRGFSLFCDKEIYGKRRKTANKLAKSTSIDYEINIADSDANVEKYILDAEKKGETEDIAFAVGLKNNNNLLNCKMSVDFGNKDNKMKVKTVFEKINECLTDSKKVYIHCDEGKDRTGFIFIILNALAGANQEQIRENFMESFANEYGVKKGTDLYQTIVDIFWSSFLEELTDGSLYPEDLKHCAEQFLITCGVPLSTVLAIEQKITVQ